MAEFSGSKDKSEELTLKGFSVVIEVFFYSLTIVCFRE